MATDNIQVTTYLPPHIIDYVESYCNEKGIVRKKDSKPLLATGIVDLLNILVNIPIEDLSKFSSQSLGVDTIEKKLTDSKVLNKLLDTLLGDNQLRQRLQNALIPDDFLRDDKTFPSTLPVSEDEDNDNLPLPYLTSNLNEDEVIEVRKDDQNIYEKNLKGSAIEIESKEVIEDKPKKRGGNTKKVNENGFTDAQQRVMDKIPLVKGVYSYSGLAKVLGVSRPVLDNFDQWRQYFTFNKEKNTYTKM